MRAVTPDGYTLIVDPITSYICYALRTADGDLVSSGVVYDGAANGADLLALRITKGAIHSRERRDESDNAKRCRLNPNLGKINPRIAARGRSSFEVLQPIAEPVPSGTITGLVVLVDFPDRRYSIAVSEVANAFNGTGTYGSTWRGSIRKWSEPISDGATSVQHKVVGYHTAKYCVSHYNAPSAEWDYSTSEERYDEVYAYVDINGDRSPLCTVSDVGRVDEAYGRHERHGSVLADCQRDLIAALQQLQQVHGVLRCRVRHEGSLAQPTRSGPADLAHRQGW